MSDVTAKKTEKRQKEVHMTAYGSLSSSFTADDGRYIVNQEQPVLPADLEHKIHEKPRLLVATLKKASNLFSVVLTEEEGGFVASVTENAAELQVKCGVSYKKLSAPVSRFMQTQIETGSLPPGFTAWDSTTVNGRKIAMNVSREIVGKILATAVKFGVCTYHFDPETRDVQHIQMDVVECDNENIVLAETIIYDYKTGPIKDGVLKALSSTLYRMPVFMNNPMQFHLFLESKKVPSLMGFTTHFPIGLWGCNSIYPDKIKEKKKSYTDFKPLHNILINVVGRVAQLSTLLSFPVKEVLQPGDFGFAACEYLIPILVDHVCFTWGLEGLLDRHNLMCAFYDTLKLKKNFKLQFPCIIGNSGKRMSLPNSVVRSEPWFDQTKPGGRELLITWIRCNLNSDSDGTDDDEKEKTCSIMETDVKVHTKKEINDDMDVDEPNPEPKAKEKAPQLTPEERERLKAQKANATFINSGVRVADLDKMSKEQLIAIVNQLIEKLEELSEHPDDVLMLLEVNGLIKLVSFHVKKM